MKFKFLDAMREAARLTRGQNLTEATRGIMRTLGGGDTVSQPSPETPEPLTRSRLPLGETLAGLPKFDMPNLGGVNLGDAATLLRGATPPIKAPEGAAFITRSYANEAGSREYKVYVPTNVAAHPALIVMLHGCTQNANDFAAGTRMNELAEERGFIVAYPEQSNQANHLGCWNWFNPADQKRGSGEASIIAGITRDIISEFGVDAARVYVAGLSAGGAMAEVMSVTYPDLFAGAGVHSGLVYGVASDAVSAFAAMNGKSNGKPNGAGRGRGAERVRTIVFHGALDKKVHPDNAEMIVAEARAGLAQPVRETIDKGSAGGRAYTRTRAFDAKDIVQVERWEIEGLGHAWSGGSRAGSHSDPQGPDASREMVRFFLEAS